MLHYYVQRFFNQTLLSAVLENNKVVVYYVDDHMTQPQDHVTLKSDHMTQTADHVTGRKVDKNILMMDQNKLEKDHVLRFEQQKTIQYNHKTRSSENVTVYVNLFSFDQIDNPINTWSETFLKPTNPSTVIYKADLDLLFNQSPCTLDTCFLVVTLDPENHEFVPSSVLFLSYFKDIAKKGLKDANVQVEMVSAVDGKGMIYEIDLKSEAIAPFVWLEARGIKGRFSDNGFLMTGTHRKVTFYSWDEVSVESLRQSLSVRSLMDMYTDE